MAKILKGIWKLKREGSYPDFDALGNVDSLGQRLNFKWVEELEGIAFRRVLYDTDEYEYNIFLLNNFSLWENSGGGVSLYITTESPNWSASMQTTNPPLFMFDLGAEGQEVEDWFYEWVNANMIPAYHQNIKGVWKLESSDAILLRGKNMEMSVSFLDSEGNAYVGIAREIDDLGDHYYYAVDSSGNRTQMLCDYEADWTEKFKTITVTEEETDSAKAEDIRLFLYSAYIKETDSIPSVSYNGVVITAIESGNTATLPVKDKKMVGDIVITVPKAEGGTDSPLPTEVSTEAEMTALLTSGEIGGVYKYTGATGTYENGAYYVLEKA